MGKLIRAALVRYMKDFITLIALILALANGMWNGYFARDQYTSGLELYIDDMMFIFGMLFALIVIVLGVGREFSDHTIRNKLIVGCSRTQIVCAEMTAGMIVALVFYLLTTMPLLILQWKSLMLLPTDGLLKCYLILLAAFLFCGVFAAGLTTLIGHRTYAIIAVGAVLFGLYAASYWLDGRIDRGAEQYYSWTEFRYEEQEDGTLIEIPIEHKEENPYYLPEDTRKMLTQINNLNPATGVANVTRFFFYTDVPKLPEEKAAYDKEVQRDNKALTVMLPEELALCALIFGLGILCFKRRDVK